MKMIQDIIIRPIITEESNDMIRDKKYVFKVMKSATKPEIMQAVETMFKVEVLKVNTSIVKKKPKRMGVHAGYTTEWKKAIVTLTEKSKPIDFFEGLN